jgi:alpha-D-xyloside xylohydrolase
MNIREDMRPYIRKLMAEAHEKGSPVMRTLFYEFPVDEAAWEVEEQYMFGGKYMCCPVLEAGKRTMNVYLPKLPKQGRWKEFSGEASWEGGSTITVDCPLERMPVFERM